MTRTWVLLLGMALLWASTCIGMEEYAEPTGDVGVGEGTVGVGDPGAVIGYEPAEPKPQEDYSVTDSGGDSEVVKPEGGDGTVVTEPASEGEYHTTDSEVSGDGEVIGPETDGESGVPGRDYRIYTMTANGGDEAADPGVQEVHQLVALASQRGYAPADLVPEGGFEANPLPAEDAEIPTLTPDMNKAIMLAQLAGGVTGTVGTPEQISGLAMSALNERMNWIVAPELSQVQSGAGIDMAAQMATCAQAFNSLPAVAGQFNNAASQISAGVQEAFSAIPGVSNLLAGQ
jgi:hypothetical protein